MRFQQIELHRLPYKSVVTPRNITKWIIVSIVKLSISEAILSLVYTTRYDWNPQTYAFSPFKDLHYYYLLGLAFLFLFESCYTLGATLMCLYFKIDFVPVMTNP